MSLNFSVLNGSTAQSIVQFYGEDCGRSGLVLCGFLADPVVDIPTEFPTRVLSLQDQIRIPFVEFPEFRLLHRDGGKVLQLKYHYMRHPHLHY